MTTEETAEEEAGRPAATLLQPGYLRESPTAAGGGGALAECAICAPQEQASQTEEPVLTSQHVLEDTAHGQTTLADRAVPGWPAGTVRLILVWGDGALPTAITLSYSRNPRVGPSRKPHCQAGGKRPSAQMRGGPIRPFRNHLVLGRPQARRFARLPPGAPALLGRARDLRSPDTRRQWAAGSLSSTIVGYFPFGRALLTEDR